MSDDCLSRRIDLFDDVLNKKRSVEGVVNKTSEDNGRLTSSQGITMLQKIQHLQMAYLNVINSDFNKIYQEFLAAFNLKSISTVTTWRWMKSIEFSYCERGKNYFTDKHEDQNTRKDRIKFIEKYFTPKKNTYRWIHLKEEDAKKMEQDTDNPSLENS